MSTRRRAGVVIDGISKSYDTGHGRIGALRDVSLTVRAGEVVVLLGPSGAGKSTLLEIVAGLVTPSAGRVVVDGDEVRGPSPDRALVFQEYALVPWLTAERNLALALEFAGVPRAERRERCRAQLDVMGLSRFARAYPSQLSGGMRQRVALARALICDPHLLLLDEPLGALDEITRRRLQQRLLETFAATANTVLLVTHSVDEALVLADRVAVLSGSPGRVRAVLDVGGPRLPRRDLDSPAMIDLRARLWSLLDGEGDADASPVGLGAYS